MRQKCFEDRKKEPELEDLENAQPICITKDKNVCLGENANGCEPWNQLTISTKVKNRDGIILPEKLPAGPKVEKNGTHEGRPSDFLDPTGLDYRTVRLPTYAILQDKGGRTLKATQKIIRVATPSTGPECLVPGDRTIFTLISKRGIKAQWSPGGVSPILTENHGKEEPLQREADGKCPSSCWVRLTLQWLQKMEMSQWD